MHWLTKGWWKYLLMRPRSVRAFFCRAGGHKGGVVHYSMYELEPDMHCLNCGDNLK